MKDPAPKGGASERVNASPVFLNLSRTGLIRGSLGRKMIERNKDAILAFFVNTLLDGCALRII